MIHPLLHELRPMILELKQPMRLLYEVAGISRQAHHNGLLAMSNEDEKELLKLIDEYNKILLKKEKYQIIAIIIMKCYLNTDINK
jgi:hypothetical protein